MNIALILSGGTGSRLGTDIPKQYLEVKGRPVISYCIEQFIRHEGIDAVQIVAAMCWRGTILRCLGQCGCPPYGGMGRFRGFSDPGESRQQAD